MTLKLVSFKACPFVQRVAITIQYKGIDYDIEYVDLGSPPDWFLAISVSYTHLTLPTKRIV